MAGGAADHAMQAEIKSKELTNAKVLRYVNSRQLFLTIVNSPLTLAGHNASRVASSAVTPS
jgi:hypothetical protein